MSNPDVWHRVMQNGSSSGQYWQIEFGPMNVRQFVELLQNACESRNHSTRTDACRLRDQNALGCWRIVAGPHRGGIGNTAGVDQNAHITIRTPGSKQAHCQLDGKGFIWRITYGDEDRLGEPWQAPGTPLPAT